MAGASALQSLAGGITGHAEAKAKNKALQSAIDTQQQRIAELVERRKEAISYRANEAQKFLNDYAMTMDPQRSATIANMYSNGQERFRADLASNDQLQDNARNTISNLQANKQSESVFGHIVAPMVGAAASGAAAGYGQEWTMDQLTKKV